MTQEEIFALIVDYLVDELPDLSDEKAAKIANYLAVQIAAGVKGSE